MTNETAQPRRLADTLSAMVSLTPAQHALLERISRHAQPVTVAQLAQESDLHVSSVRETLEGLLDLGLIEREQLPSQGRGRPALGYSTSMPADPAFAAQMLGQFAHSVFAWLRMGLEDPAAAARSIGHRWADAALSEMNVPEHSHREAAEGFSIAGHMGKVRLFLTAMGFGAQPRAEDPLAVVLTACPFAEADAPDGLAFELRRGIVERVFERTATGVATWRLEQDDTDPMVLVVHLEAAVGPRPKPLATTLRFFGGGRRGGGRRHAGDPVGRGARHPGRPGGAPARIRSGAGAGPGRVELPGERAIRDAGHPLGTGGAGRRAPALRGRLRRRGLLGPFSCDPPATGGPRFLPRAHRDCRRALCGGIGVPCARFERRCRRHCVELLPRPGVLSQSLPFCGIGVRCPGRCGRGGC